MKIFIHVSPEDGLTPTKIIAVDLPCCPNTMKTVKYAVDAGDFPSLSSEGGSFTADMVVSALRVYEGPVEPPGYGHRDYATQFDQATTRHINFELHFVNPEPRRRIDFDVDYLIHGPEGLLGEGTLNTYLEPDWTTSHHNVGWGWAEPGHWPAGQYTVEFSIEGRKVAEGSFEIVDGGAVMPPPPPPPPGERRDCPATAPSPNWDMEMGPAPLTRWYWTAELGLYCGYIYGGRTLNQYRLEPTGTGYYMVIWDRAAEASGTYSRTMRLDRGDPPDPSTGLAETGPLFALQADGTWKQISWWFIRVP